MMELTEKRQLLALYDAFAVFDEDGSGTISVVELKNVVERLGLQVTDIRRMLSFADKDGDGTVSFSEFTTILGYTGPMYELDELRQAVQQDEDDARSSMLSGSAKDSDSDSSSSDSDSNDSNESGDSACSGDSGTSQYEIELNEGEVLVKVIGFYTDETFHFGLPLTTAMRTLSDLVNKRAQHFDAKLLRFYLKGFSVEISKKSLKDVGYDGTSPFYLVYEHGSHRLPSAQVWSAPDSKPNPWAILRIFLREGRIEDADAVSIVKQASRLFHAEPNMLTISADADERVVVVGDIHGQLYDLLNLFDAAGDLGPARRYVFMGDYVDRGYFSAEVVLFLFAAKIRWPEHVFLLRGNHEDSFIAERYGTKKEIETKYSNRLWRQMLDAFAHLPLAALLIYADRRFFCCHGGISNELLDLSDMEKWNRHHVQIPRSGPLRDITWADPVDELRAGLDAEAMPKRYVLADLARRDERVAKKYLKTAFVASGGSHQVLGYTLDGVSTFLYKNNLVGLFRGHEQVNKGPDFGKYGPRYAFPSSTTVFGAPNYTDCGANIASAVVFEDGAAEFVTYGWRLHPQYASYLTAKKAGRSGKASKSSKATRVHSLVLPPASQDAVERVLCASDEAQQQPQQVVQLYAFGFGTKKASSASAPAQAPASGSSGASVSFAAKKQVGSSASASRASGASGASGSSSGGSSGADHLGEQNTFGHAAGERLWEVEDLVQFCNFLDPSMLRSMTIHYVVAEFMEMFRSATRKTSASSEGERGWKFVSQNISSILKQSRDPEVLRRLQAKTELMQQWYRDHDYFSENVEKERAFEKNVFAPDAPKYSDSFMK